MKRQFKKILSTSLILALLSMNLVTPVYATSYMDWGNAAAKAASKCATSYISKWAVSQLTSVIDSFLGSATTVSVKDSTQANNNAVQACISTIAIGLAKSELTQITTDTFKWINTGLSGNPFYVANIDSYLNKIQNDLLSKEISIFKDPANAGAYPYGHDFAVGEVNLANTLKDQTSALKTNLSSYLSDGATTASFAGDFSKGGWDGWMALTQQPQNNPLGFNMMASQMVADKQQTATQNTKAEVAQGNGFLSQKKCVEWDVVDKNGDQVYNDDGSELTTKTKPATPNPTGNDTCINYQTMSPGSIIKDQLTKVVNSPTTQLELVRTLDDALNALLDGLLGSLHNNGISGAIAGTAGNTTDLNSTLPNITIDDNGNVVIGDNGTGSTTSGSFNIKDLGNIIKTQNDYIDLMNKNFGILTNLMPALGQLDYCIPGPNSNWETNSQDAIVSLTEKSTESLSVNNLKNDLEIGKAKEALAQLDQYRTLISTTFGSNSPMLDPSTGNTSYLSMAQAGLDLTSKMTTIEDSANTTKETDKTLLSQTNSNLPELKLIEDGVNKIIQAAQKRRDADRAKNGLKPVTAACLASELIN